MNKIVNHDVRVWEGLLSDLSFYVNSLECRLSKDEFYDTSSIIFDGFKVEMMVGDSFFELGYRFKYYYYYSSCRECLLFLYYECLSDIVSLLNYVFRRLYYQVYKSVYSICFDFLCIDYDSQSLKFTYVSEEDNFSSFANFVLISKTH